MKETKNIERKLRFLVIELLLMDVDGNPFPKKEFSSSSSVQFNPLLSQLYEAELKIASISETDVLFISSREAIIK